MRRQFQEDQWLIEEAASYDHQNVKFSRKMGKKGHVGY